jgi:SAM-dependent methyltransferase
MFNRYLSAGFLAANPATFSAVAEELELNYAPYLPASRDAAVLDVGCGMGQFLFYLKEKGYTHLLGVDVSDEAAEFCKNNVIQNVARIDDLCAFLETRPDAFDLVMMKDVIEHLPRAAVLPTLAAIHRALKPRGTVLIETGNMAAWTGTFLFYNDFTHVSGFTETSLRNVLTAVGFQRTQIIGYRERMNWRGRVLAALWRSILRLIYRAERGPQGVPSILTRLLIAVAQK